MDSFAQKKQFILNEIANNSEDNPDDSPKGTIDEALLPLIDSINGHEDFVTTSSCSGRLSVFLEGEKADKVTGKGGGKWLFVSHDPKEIDGWPSQVNFSEDSETHEFDGHTRYVLFKFEAMILHVKCRSLAAASALYSAAMGCGFRESGIGSNNNVAIRISLKIDCPVGYCNDKEQLKLLVSRQYLELLTQQSHVLFTENFRRMDMLHSAIDKIGKQEEVKEETKEERAVRKREEGLRRQAEARSKQEGKGVDVEME